MTAPERMGAAREQAALDDFAQALCEADAPSLDYERREPDESSEAGWPNYRPMAVRMRELGFGRVIQETVRSERELAASPRACPSPAGAVPSYGTFSAATELPGWKRPSDAFTDDGPVWTADDLAPVAYAMYNRSSGALKWVEVLSPAERDERAEFYDVIPLYHRGTHE